MNWEYIAGFFDGEGSILNNGRGFRVAIPQTNLDVLYQIQKFTKVGKVFAVTKRQSHWKDSWVYYIAKQRDVQFFLKHMKPHVIVKKEGAIRALPQLEEIIKRQNARTRRAQLLTQKAKKLREKGLTYRAIGKRLKIDWGYTRRIILYK